MSSEQNKQLVQRFYEAIDKGDLDAMDELVAENYVDHNLLLASEGKEGLKQVFRTFQEANSQAITKSKIKSLRATKSSRA